MITLCVLNWNRPELLREIVLPSLASYRLIDEIIVSHGREDMRFEFDSSDARVVMRDDSGGVNREYGVARRWLCWEQARNDTVLSLDDDLLLPESALDVLWAAFREDPEIMHGAVHANDGFDSFMPREAGETVAVAGAYLAPRALGRACLDGMSDMSSYARDPFYSHPIWDGDDLFASATARRLSGRQNRAHRVVCRNLGVFIPGHNIRHGVIRDKRRARFALRIADATGASAPARQYGVLRRAKRKVGEAYFEFLAAMRQKPSFLILGAGRGGTTSLFEYLCSHPRVARPERKELRALNHRKTNSARERYSYLRGFPRKTASDILSRRRDMLTGEATPLLLSSAVVPRHLRIEFPSVRMIALLRNPVDRLFSSYRMHKKRAADLGVRDFPSLAEALEIEENLVRAGVPRMLVAQWPDSVKHYFPDQGASLGEYFRAFFTHGLYADWLARYFALFPREQVLVLQSERLFADPSGVLARVHAFLGLETAPRCRPELFPHENKAPVVDADDLEALRPSLVERYAEPNARMFKLLGETYDWR